MTEKLIESLNAALMLLEMHNTSMFQDEGATAGLIVAAHAIIQNACALMQGRPITQEDVISETLAIVWARVAIADAKSPLPKE